MVPDNDPNQGQPAANPGTNPPVNRPSTPPTDNAGYDRGAALKAAYERQAEQREGNAKEADQDHLVEGKSEADRFRTMIRNSLSHMTPEQRACVAEEVARIQLAELAKVPRPNAELEANEADKIKRAEEAVRPGGGVPPAPPAGGEGAYIGEPVGPGPANVLDMSQYEKIGEQWRMCLGSVAGHMQYRWLSDAEAKAIGLEVPKGVSERIDGLGPLDLKPRRSPPLRPADLPEGLLD